MCARQVLCNLPSSSAQRLSSLALPRRSGRSDVGFRDPPLRARPLQTVELDADEARRAARITDSIEKALRGDLRLPEVVARRAAGVLRPAGALARLDELAVWLAGWQGTPRPAVRRPAAVVFAADHGVARRGVSAYPAEVTAARAKIPSLQHGRRFEVTGPMAEPAHLHVVRGQA